MTRLLAVAWLRIAAVSTISTMKVERPRARSSAAPTRLNRRSTMPIVGLLGRHEGAGLRHHRDQRVLAQEGRLAGHVGAGQQPQAPLGAELAIVGHEARPPWRSSAASTTGWRPPSMREGRVVAQHWAHVVRAGRELRQCRGDVEGGQRTAGGNDGCRNRHHLPDQRVEDRELQRERLIGGAADPGL